MFYKTLLAFQVHNLWKAVALPQSPPQKTDQCPETPALADPGQGGAAKDPLHNVHLSLQPKTTQSKKQWRVCASPLGQRA